MAIGTPTTYTATTDATTGASGSTTSGSITPSADDVVWVAVYVTINDGGADGTTTLSVSDSGWTKSTAWTRVGRAFSPMDCDPTLYCQLMEIWACKVTSGGAQTVTVTRSSSAGGRNDMFFWAVYGKHSGGDVPAVAGTSNAGTVHSAGTSPQSTVFGSAPASTSAAIGVSFCSNFGTPTVTQPSGWSEVTETYFGGFGCTAEAAYKVGSVSQSNSWAFTSTGSCGLGALAVEFPVAAGGGGATPVGSVRAYPKAITRAATR